MNSVSQVRMPVHSLRLNASHGAPVTVPYAVTVLQMLPLPQEVRDAAE